MEGLKFYQLFGIRYHIQAILVAILIGTILPSSKLQAQRVTPFQSGSYLPVLTSLRDFSPAPRGMYFISYNYWVSPQGYYDRDGNNISGINIELPTDTPQVVDLFPEAKAFMGMLALYYSSKEIEELANARYSFLIGPSFQMTRYKVDAIVGSDSISVKGGIAGYGDLFIQPFGLSWSFNDHFDLSFYYGLYLPTANYQSGEENNLGYGHITHQFQVPFLAYLNEQATAFALVPTYEISGWVIDRDVKPGSRLSLEYGISQYFTSWLEVEIMNSHNWQIGSDKGEDAWWLGTAIDTKDRKNLASIGVSMWPWEERLQLRFKYVWEYGVVQNTASNYFCFSILFSPHWLNKN